MDINKQKAVVTLRSVKGDPVLEIAPKVLAWHQDFRPIVLIGVSEPGEEQLTTFEVNAILLNEENGGECYLNLIGNKPNGGYTLKTPPGKGLFTLSGAGKTPVTLDQKSSELVGWVFREVRLMAEQVR